MVFKDNCAPPTFSNKFVCIEFTELNKSITDGIDTLFPIIPICVYNSKINIIIEILGIIVNHIVTIVGLSS